MWIQEERGIPELGDLLTCFLGQKTQLLEQAQALASSPWGGGLPQGSSMTPGKPSAPGYSVASRPGSASKALLNGMACGMF